MSCLPAAVTAGVSAMIVLSSSTRKVWPATPFCPAILSVEFDEKLVPVMVTKVLPAVGPCAGDTVATVGDVPAVNLNGMLTCVVSLRFMTTMLVVVPPLLAALWLGVVSWKVFPAVPPTEPPFTRFFCALPGHGRHSQMKARAPA